MGFTPSSGSDHECNNCGAHLPPWEADGTRTCSFCSTRYQKPSTPPAGGPGVGAGPQIIITPTVPQVDWSGAARTAKRTGGGCGLVMTVFILLVVGGVVLAVTRFSDTITSAFKPAAQLTGPVLLVPGEPSVEPAKVAITQTYDSGASRSVYSLQKIDGAGATVWTASLPDAASYTPILTDGTQYYVVVKAQVLAVRDRDGTVAWQRTLTDEVQVTSCEQCFFLVGDRLVTQSADGNLQALDTASGAPAWQRTLIDTRAQAVPYGGDRVLLADGKPNEAQLYVLGALDGTEQSVVRPSCPTGSAYIEEFTIDANIVPLPLENAVVMGFGFGEACWQRLDLGSGAPVWSSESEDTTLGRNYTDVLVGDGNRLVAVDSGVVSIVDLGSGAVTDLGGDSGQTRAAIALVGDTLVMREESSRGTTRYSVAAYDAASGAQRWTVDLGAVAPADPPDANTTSVSSSEAGRFVVSVQGGTVRIVTFRGGSYDFTVQNVDLATGVAPGTATVPGGFPKLSAPSFRPAGWVGPKVVLEVEDQLVTIDTATATITNRWPA